jgi:ABC-2 type transport system permease protein
MAEAAAPSSRDLVWRQVRYQNRIFWRTPVAAFFTLIFPAFFLVVFPLLFGNERIDALGVTTAQFYAPVLAVFGVVSATYTNLAIMTTIARDEGILKRIRGTPLPSWIYLAGRIGSATYLAAISVVIMLGVGVAFYGVQIFARTVPAAIVTFLVGVACFAALGMLVAALAPSSDAAPAITNATLLPLAFVSDIFIPPSSTKPAWVDVIADVFPLKHFATAFRDAFDPTLSGAQWHWGDLAVMAAWGIAALLLAMRFFTWEPRGGERTRSRRRRSRAGV